MLKRLRLLLAFGLVPVVIFGTPETAAAANPWHQVDVAPDIPGMPDSMDCTINLQHSTDGQSLNLGGNSACSGSTDISPGVGQWGEEGSNWALTVYGTGSDGECTGTGTGTFGAHSSSGVFNVAGAFGSTEIVLPPTDAGCHIEQVCLYLYPGGNMAETDKCVTVDIPPPVLEEIQCQWGDVAAVEVEPVTRLRQGQSALWDYWWDINVYFANTDYVNWNVWRVTRGTSFSADYSKVGTSIGGGLAFSQSFGSSVYAPGSPQMEASLQASKPTSIQVYALDQTNNTGSGYDPQSATLASAFPPLIPDGAYRGLTMAPQCRYYFGTKVVSIPNTDADEPGPISDLYVPPDEEGPTEEPTVEPIEIIPEPVESESGFWAIVVGLLRLILGAIKAVAAAITGLVKLILDGLKALFVPDSDSWGIGSLVDQLQNKPPFSIAASTYNAGEVFADKYSDAGNCGVLADFGAIDVTCSKVQSVPGYGALYSLVSAGLICLTGLGIFRMIGDHLEAGQ